MTHDEHDARTSAPSDATSPEPLSDGSNDAEVRAIAERLVRERRVGAPANPDQQRTARRDELPAAGEERVDAAPADRMEWPAAITIRAACEAEPDVRDHDPLASSLAAHRFRFLDVELALGNTMLDAAAVTRATTGSGPRQRRRIEHVMRRLQAASVALATCLAALACGDAPRPSMPDGVDLHVTPLSIRRSDLDRLGRLRLRGAVAVQARNEAFGSYSGLHVSADGTRLVAVGWGSWLVGRPRHGPTGNLTGFALDGVFPLRDAGGQPITDDADKDAESLVEREGHYYVGFETNTRVARYRGIDGAAETVHLPAADLAAIPKCCGFSSVAFTARQELLALTEGARDSADNVKGWLWRNGRAEPRWLRGDSPWLPVDIALLPDGDLLLVEVREDLWSERWHSRFSRIADTDVRSGGIMPAHPLGELYSVDHPTRIEGIHARKGSAGETLLYAISDSPRGWPTTLLMFELAERSDPTCSKANPCR